MVLKRCKRSKEQANQTTRKEVDGSPLLSLPVHLLFHIFDRLPFYTILDCKCVCNTLKDILSDPYFLQLHFAKASGNDNIMVIQDAGDRSKIFLTPLLDLDKHAFYPKTNNGSCLWRTLTPPALIPKTKKYLSSIPYLVGSCNGLLCLRYYTNPGFRLCVCNPILGEFTIVSWSEEITTEVNGFGFCTKTQQYKFLRCFPESGHCEILTLGTNNNWRRIIVPPPFPSLNQNMVSSYNGNFHWIIELCEKTKTKSICSFNLATERYSYISLPVCFNNQPNVSRTPYCNNIKLQIGTLDGLFCVSFFSPAGHFEAYVMEDDEMNGPWIKRVSIDTRYCSPSCAENIFLDVGVLVIHRSTRIFFYDTRKGTTSIIFLKNGYHSSVCVQPSLVSLKDIVRREKVEQLEWKKRHVCS